jgi:hypothetical protein
MGSRDQGRRHQHELRDRTVLVGSSDFGQLIAAET